MHLTTPVMLIIASLLLTLAIAIQFGSAVFNAFRCWLSLSDGEEDMSSVFSGSSTVFCRPLADRGRSPLFSNDAFRPGMVSSSDVFRPRGLS